MANWLYPANTQYHDVLGAFSKKTVYWPAKTKVSKGDKIYIYLAAPHKQIAFIGEVTQVDITEESVIEDIKRFFKQLPKKKGEPTPFMKIGKIQRVDIEADSPLALSSLKTHGLRGMLMGPRNLENNQTLLNYFQEELE
ncbi:MAG: hypothetical protein OEZ43_02445 [Gammaproteobacteria bacterium]|nr:hypothetical protein [Gammaproteobacteria bacterium]